MMQAAETTTDFRFCASRYTGKERDSESGNDYFGARYYASTMGRFLSPDWSAKEEPVPYAKLDNPQTLNLYQYMRNNPLSGTDPDGHCCWESQFVMDLLNGPVGQAINQGFSNFMNNGANALQDPTGRSQTMIAIGMMAGAATPAPPMEDVVEAPAITVEVTATAPSAIETTSAPLTEAIPAVETESSGIKGAPAPDQVSPGINNVKGVYDGEHGEQPYSAHYDEYGRQVGRTDYTSAPDATNHPNPHYHTREYGPGYGPKGRESGPIPGEHPLDQQHPQDEQ